MALERLKYCCKEQLQIIWKDQWESDGKWIYKEINIPSLRSGDAGLMRRTGLTLIFACANRIRGCDSCRLDLSNVFGIPEVWWAEYARNANGYFGSETTADGQGQTVTSVKVLRDEKAYEWHKTNVLVRWLASSRQTFVLLFDAPDGLRSRMPSLLLDGLHRDNLADPFWIYGPLVEEVVRLQDQAVWATRTQVRNMEKGRTQTYTPGLDFAHVHDVARHAIHVSETLDVGIKTLGEVLREHAVFTERAAAEPSKRNASRAVDERLLFLQHMLEGLRSRAASNQARLDNEKQLAFYMVTQYNAQLSLQMGQSVRSDSTAMRAMAFLTLTFLPATFISAIFSTSFFSYNAETGWTMSSDIWVYWAFAIPVTVITAGVSFWWQNSRIAQSPKEERPS